MDKRDKTTRKTRWEQLDEDLDYTPAQLDRAVVAPDQIRTIIKTFKVKCPTEIFPGRTEVPKTLVFAKDDSHAEDIVHIVREEFGKGNDFCKKITYKTTNSYNPRIAVTVDMVSTGVDIRPLECLLFMRDVKSRVYFDQMKGRGTRTVSSTDLRSVTPDTPNKTHFVIVDAVGVCETDKTDTRPLEKKPHVPFDRLITQVAMGIRDQDSITSLAGRLARLDREIDDKDRKEIEGASRGLTLRQIINGLLDAVDPDTKIARAKETFRTEKPTEDQVKKAGETLMKTACAPFDNPGLRNTFIDIKKRHEQVIDTVSKDTVTFAGFDDGARDKARRVVETFRKFIEENRDDITALQMIYGRPYKKRHLTYEGIKGLAEAIEKPPYRLTPDILWQAYEQLERSKVRGAGPQKLLSDIISLVRFAVGKADVLEPFSETVGRRFTAWIARQEKDGRRFTPEQREWLTMIKDHISSSLSVEMADFELAPFYEKGGSVRASLLFGPGLNGILEELNNILAA